jgi:hypothetical protein
MAQSGLDLALGADDEAARVQDLGWHRGGIIAMTKRSGAPDNPSQRGVSSTSTRRAGARRAARLSRLRTQPASRTGQTTAIPLFINAAASTQGER